VLVDDLRWDALSCMGHPYVKTPHIDKLRSRGALFQNAFVTTSICCPSRATFLTGVYAHQHGVIDNETSEYNPDVTPPVTKYLQQAGYQTAMIGKWHMGKTAAPRRYFDHWVSFKGQGKYHDPLFNINGEIVQDKGYTTDILTDRAIGFIEKQPKDKPYFLMLSHKAVHEPFQPPPRHQNAFGAATVELEPRSWSDDLKNKPAWQRLQKGQDLRWKWRTSQIEKISIPEAIEPAPWPNQTKGVDQFRCVAAVDDGVGRIMAVLRKRGTLDNTLIVFTSDNGYFHHEHRRWDKRLAYEESARIPMVMALPGKIEPNSTVTQLVSNLDFAPTVLAYAGRPIPDQMQGLSLKTLFEQASSKWRDSVFYEYWVDLVHDIPSMVAVRTAQHKLIHYPELSDVDELYDMSSDPHELENLAVDPEYRSIHAAMKKRLDNAISESGWKLNVFPKNLPRVRGKSGVMLNLNVEAGELKNSTQQSLKLNNVVVLDDSLKFDGDKSEIRIPFNEDLDPSTWPYEIQIDVKPERGGVVAMQANKRYGFKIFVQNGRPGLALLCKSWIAVETTIDGSDNILGKWTNLSARIDYNRVIFKVNGVVVESRALPQPFKGKTNLPLIIGSIGKHAVSEGVPHVPLEGEIRSVTISRELTEGTAVPAVAPINLFRDANH